jgi:hypothetical protein
LISISLKEQTMTPRTFAARLAALEALERAQQPELPAYICLHPRDAAALGDVATPPEVRAAIAADYRLSGRQKLYVGCCLCWGDESCRVCADQPLVAEMKVE